MKYTLNTSALICRGGWQLSRSDILALSLPMEIDGEVIPALDESQRWALENLDQWSEYPPSTLDGWAEIDQQARQWEIAAEKIGVVLGTSAGRILTRNSMGSMGGAGWWRRPSAYVRTKPQITTKTSEAPIAQYAMDYGELPPDLREMPDMERVVMLLFLVANGKSSPKRNWIARQNAQKALNRLADNSRYAATIQELRMNNDVASVAKTVRAAGRPLRWLLGYKD